MKRLQRTLSMLLVCCMMIGIFPATAASAAGTISPTYMTGLTNLNSIKYDVSTSSNGSKNLILTVDCHFLCPSDNLGHDRLSPTMCLEVRNSSDSVLKQNWAYVTANGGMSGEKSAFASLNPESVPDNKIKVKLYIGFLAYEKGVSGWGASIASAFYVGSLVQFDLDLTQSSGVIVGGSPGEEVSVTGISLNKFSITLTSIDASEQLVATISPTNATNKAVTWKSSNTSVATVDSTGKVVAVGNGEATITATTSNGGFSATCVVTVKPLKAPALEEFDPTIYRAICLHDDLDPTVKNINSSVNDDTPCEIMVDALQESGFDESVAAWKSFEIISNAMSNVASLADCITEPKDLYSAVILNALEASVTYDYVPNDLEKTLKFCDDFVNEIKDLMKLQYGIDIRNERDFKNMSIDAKKQLAKDIEKWFGNVDPELDELGDVFDNVSKGLELVSSIEEFYERLATTCHVAKTNKYMKEVIRELYEDSKATNNIYLQLALSDCVKILDSSTGELIRQIITGELVVIGTDAAKYLVKELLWKEVTNTLYATHPAVAIWHATYKANKFIMNLASSTDDTVEQYLKMLAILDFEALTDNTYHDLKKEFWRKQDTTSAHIYLSALDLIFQLRNEDTVRAYDFVDILDNTLINKISKLFGKDSFGKMKEYLRIRQQNYFIDHELALTFWINSLDADYPNSGLYEHYQYLFENSSNRVLSKEFVAACPIDVYVYDESNQVVASIVDGRVSCNGEVMVALNGEQKIVRFYDNQNYKIEYVGTDVGEMDVTISEYNEAGTSVRTVNYYNVDLESGKKYYTNVTDEILSAIPYVLVNEGDQTVVDADYDSLLKSGDMFQVSVQRGSLLRNGEIFFTTNVGAGETLEINAIVPDGYRFLRWQTFGDPVRIGDETAESTTFVMPDFNVEIYAVLEEDVLVTGVTLDEENLTLTEVGEALTLTATIFPSNATNQTVSWVSNNPDVAIVSNSGVVTAVANGTAIITVTTEDGSFTATCAVMVDIPSSDTDCSTGHKLSEVPAVAATCKDTGIIAHWHCDVCGENFIDATGTTKLNDVTAPKDSDNHTGGTELRGAKEATATEPGYTGDIHCVSCGAKLESGTEIPVHTCMAGSAWFYDEETHWNKCTGHVACEQRLNEAAHTGGTATCIEQAICSVCDQSYGDVSSHIPSNWIYDQNSHWKICGTEGCGIRTEQAIHTFGNDNTCDICSYIKPSEQPDIPSRPSVDSSDSGDRETISYTVLTPKTENGSVTVTPKNASKGTVVTLTLEPNEGYELDKLTVTDRNGKELSLTDKGDNKFTFVMPSGIVNVNVSFRPVETTWSNPFADITEDSWYYEAVAFAMEKGIMSGYSTDTFAPNDNLSRAMLAQILYNLEGKPDERRDIQFIDVSGEAWYSDAVLWAAENGIAQGYDDRFDPEAPITREQVATMLWNYAGKPTADHTQALNYSDADKISNWAVSAMLWATENKVISGYDGMLDPAGQATRAQIAQMMKNYLDN